jgi:hypothetical protein
MVILTDDHTGCLVGLWTPDPEEIVSFAIVFLRKNSQWEREFQFMEESVRSLLELEIEQNQRQSRIQIGVRHFSMRNHITHAEITEEQLQNLAN